MVLFHSKNNRASWMYRIQLNVFHQTVKVCSNVSLSVDCTHLKPSLNDEIRRVISLNTRSIAF